MGNNRIEQQYGKHQELIRMAEQQRYQSHNTTPLYMLLTTFAIHAFKFFDLTVT
jgi:hypothetical protein